MPSSFVAFYIIISWLKGEQPQAKGYARVSMKSGVESLHGQGTKIKSNPPVSIPIQ